MANTVFDIPISTSPDGLGKYIMIHNLANPEATSTELMPYEFIRYGIGASYVEDTATISGNFELNTGTQIEGTTTIGGDVVQNSNIEVVNSQITGTIQLCNGAIVSNSTFGQDVNKLIETTFLDTDVVGHVNRLVNCSFLPNGATRNTFGGQLRWCTSFFAFGVTIAGDCGGMTFVSMINNTTVNCNIGDINGLSHNGNNYGFDNCTIQGNSSASTFGNFRVECKVSNKTITELLYPELFNVNYVKTIYKKPNGEVWYYYIDNSNTFIYTQIV